MDQEHQARIANPAPVARTAAAGDLALSPAAALAPC